jgi:hypothetical protein
MKKQEEVVTAFISSLGRMVPPIIDAELVRNFITNIVVDSESLEEFITGIDRYSKHSQTFQMGLLLHSISSVLCFSPLGSPVKQVTNSFPTDVFHMSHEEANAFKELSGAKRYDILSIKLMTDTEEAKSLDSRIKAERKLDKLDDGGTVKNPIFDPEKADC